MDINQDVITFISRPRATIFADIIKILTMFINTFNPSDFLENRSVKPTDFLCRLPLDVYIRHDFFSQLPFDVYTRHY